MGLSNYLHYKKFLKHILFPVLVLSCLLLLFGTLSCTEKKAGSNLKIGLLQEPKTLNIWLASDIWSHKVLSLIYQALYIRDPETLNFIPWLAKEAPVYDETALSYTIKMRQARWADGSPLTSEDVAFTGRLIREFKVPRYLSKWKFIKRIETPDKYTVKFFLKEPKAIFLTRTLSTPIVQKKGWASIVEKARSTEKPLKALLNHKMEMPMGSGPFALKEWKQGAYLFLRKNEHFFGDGKEINGRLLGPHVHGIIFKIFGTSDSAILALKKGTVDMFWWGIQPGYLEGLKKQDHIRVFLNEKSALYYMGFNVRKPPFDDVNLRRAIVTLVDKDFIIRRILQGYGTKMHSIVPPGNRFWYCRDLPAYGDGLTRDERVKKSCEILSRAGYTWDVSPIDAAGKVIKGKKIRGPDGRPMEKFTILTPPADYDPHRSMAGMIIQEWLRAVGMPAYSKPMAFGSLIDQVKTRREFDSFILGYGKLSLDPDYLRNFFHSRNDKVKGWNMSGYCNPEFDSIADQSAGSMDRAERRKMIWDMQKIILNDVPYFPLYNPKLVEAVNKERFGAWVEMLGGIGNIWSFCQIKRRLNDDLRLTIVD
ncbi:MAG: ABC transporter substrate-binding protein [Desulfobacterales bacterium]|nr:ABC transporter substrate-binding protein [Desulfobacterales bacterium]